MLSVLVGRHPVYENKNAPISWLGGVTGRSLLQSLARSGAEISSVRTSGCRQWSRSFSLVMHRLELLMIFVLRTRLTWFADLAVRCGFKTGWH